ncbi:MAG: hypothetical protein AB7L76_23280, partial [Burkholderiaceae bacterium]
MTTTILCAGALALPAGVDAGRAASDRGGTRLAGTAAAAVAAALADGALARCLARARLVRHDTDNAVVPHELPHEAWLRRRFGITGSVAAAALPSTTPALLIRPVHLHVGLDHLRLAPLHLLDIEADDARALAETARRMLSDSGLQIDVEHATHWALTAQPGSADGARLLEDLAALHARSARMAEGRSIDAYSPAGTAARQWRRLSTEVQMAWFEHPVNQRREAEGRPAINSLWLEGRTDKVA